MSTPNIINIPMGSKAPKNTLPGNTPQAPAPEPEVKHVTSNLLKFGASFSK